MKDQTIKCTYQFKLTPLEINQKSPTVHLKKRKSLLIKLGSQTVKFAKLGRSVSLITDVIYSKVLGKFCSLKGIIKVYDVMENGKEVIACVGAFQTDYLLNENKPSEILEKQIGVFSIKIKVETKVIAGIENYIQLSSSSFSEEEQINSAGDKQISPDLLTSLQKSGDTSANYLQKSAQIQDYKQSNFQKKTQIKGLEKSQKCFESEIINKSLENISFSCSDMIDEEKKKQMEILGEELIEERRKTKMLEEIIEKLNLKMQILKKKNKHYQKFNNRCQRQYEKFLKCLEADEKGQYIFELNQKKNTLTIKYKKDKDFERVFLEFLSLISKQIQSKSHETSQIEDLSSIIKRVNSIYSEKQSLQKVIDEKDLENRKLKEQIKQLNQSLEQKHQLFHPKTHERSRTFHEKTSQEKSKERQIRSRLEKKEAQVQSLSKIIENINSELKELKKENLFFMNEIQNYQLLIQELKKPTTKDNHHGKQYSSKKNSKLIHLKGQKSSSVCESIK